MPPAMIFYSQGYDQDFLFHSFCFFKFSLIKDRGRYPFDKPDP